MPFAHSPNNSGIPHDLVKHLKDVAEKAKEFAARFGGADLAYWAGLWHDLGKFNPAFQEYLKAEPEAKPHQRVPHAIWGAALTYRLIWQLRRDPESWKEVALPISGHHAGLADGGALALELENFLRTNLEATKIMSEALDSLPAPRRLHLSSRPSLRRELFIRMIFSALVDADYLDTERHFKPEQADTRAGWSDLGALWTRFAQDQKLLLARAEDTLVNRVRYEVYQACLRAAQGPQGVYRLTVPTGGDKTRSGLAFVLKHARIHRLRRIVVAIPYTSIIDQTAQTYRKILGEEAVLEHHSQVPVPENEDQDPEPVRARLASENWDAPVIVTTTVQLFESLFSNRPSKVRKLHRLANSVILLDEVQTLPPELLEPTLEVLRALVEEYGVSLVLSTPPFSVGPIGERF